MSPAARSTSTARASWPNVPRSPAAGAWCDVGRRGVPVATHRGWVGGGVLRAARRPGSARRRRRAGRCCRAGVRAAAASGATPGYGHARRRLQCAVGRSVVRAPARTGGSAGGEGGDPVSPDGARCGNREFYRVLHGGHESVVLDPTDTDQRRALGVLVGAADIVIEASRPRALAGFGLDAAAFVAGGGTWISITAHGREANRIGFGDDIAAGAGLVARDAIGPVFVGDAIADPLTGLAAAALAMSAPEGAGSCGTSRCRRWWPQPWMGPRPSSPNPLPPKPVSPNHVHAHSTARPRNRAATPPRCWPSWV